MKKMRVFLIVFFTMLLFPVVVLAGNVNGLPDLPGTLVPDDYFQTWLHYVGLNVLFLVPLINRLPIFQYEDVQKRILASVITVVSGIIGYLANWGIFYGVEWYIALTYIGFAVLGAYLGYQLLKQVLIDLGLRPRVK